MGSETDIKVPSLRSHRWILQRVSVGAIAGLFIIAMAVNAVNAPDGSNELRMADQVNAVSIGEARGAGTIVLRGDGRDSDAVIAGGEGLRPGQAVERVAPISNQSREAFDVVTLRTVATSTSLLDTDPVNG